MQNPPASHTGMSVHNNRLPDSPRSLQTGARIYPSAPHVYSPFLLHTLSALLRTPGMYRTLRLLYSDGVSRSLDVLHRLPSAFHKDLSARASPSMPGQTILNAKHHRRSMHCPASALHRLHKDLLYTGGSHPWFRSDICTCPHFSHLE